MKWYINNTENVNKWLKDFKSKFSGEHGNYTFSAIGLAILVVMYFIFGDMGRVLFLAIGLWIVARYPIALLAIIGVGLASLIVK